MTYIFRAIAWSLLGLMLQMCVPEHLAPSVYWNIVHFGKDMLSYHKIPEWYIFLYRDFVMYFPGVLLAGICCWFIGWLKHYYMISAMGFIAGTMSPAVGAYLLAMYEDGSTSTLFDFAVAIFCILNVLNLSLAWLGHRYRFRHVLKKDQAAFLVQPVTADCSVSAGGGTGDDGNCQQ